jgi:hypothetical protein
MIDNRSDSGPVIVGVDGSERSVEALTGSVLVGTGLAEALPWQ